MYSVRVGGVCLLIILIAAALPMDGLAVNPNGTGASGIISASPKLAGEATPLVSDSFFSKGSDDQGLGQVAVQPKLVKVDTSKSPVTFSGGDKPLTSQPPSSDNAKAGAKTLAAAATSNATETKKDSDGNKDAGKPVTFIPPTILRTTANTTSSTLAANNSNATSSSKVTLLSNNSNASEKSAISPGNKKNISNASALAGLGINALGNATKNATDHNITPAEIEANASSEAILPTDRIWDEDRSPADYTWTPRIFSGFFYDLDDNVGTETLTVHLKKTGATYSRTISENDLVYETAAQPIAFKFKDWGRYQVIGFMADKYFAGYKDTKILDKEISLINEGQLRKVLIDNDDQKTIIQGSIMPLEEGYELRIKEIDVNGNKVYMALAKDGKEIDSKVIVPGDIKSSTYQYNEKISGDDTPLIMVHVSSVFAGTESGLVTVDGRFQISDNYKSVQDGDKYGKMEVASVTDTGVTMKNENTISLGKGKTVEIFENVNFQVAEADKLRFAPLVERTGLYEVRGTVVDASAKKFTWTPYNFEGFYYDIDDDIGTENLTAIISGSSIEEGQLKYETKPNPVKFKFDAWGKYDVIGFMADKYFAGYGSQSKFADQFSSINEGELRKILIDSDDSQTITTGSVLPLEEGYELRIKEVDINGNKIFMAVAKDGKEIDSKVVSPSPGDAKSSNYLYEVKIGATEDVPLIAAHIESVFKGTEADLATINGLFQVSDTPTNVEEGETHGKMKVESLTDTGITMENDATISLGRGRTVEIMGNLKFMVADNDSRNFAPIAERGSSLTTLTINISQPVVVNRSMKIDVRSAGAIISGAQVLVAGKNIGNTDETGSISYTPRVIADLEVVAKKESYADGRINVSVKSAAAAAQAGKNMTKVLILNVPAQVLKNESFLIAVTGGLNQTAVEGANITFDGTRIGLTNAQGTMRHSSSIIGEHRITAEATGYDKVSRNTTIVSPIKVQTFNVSSKSPKAGQTLTITAGVQNAGTSKDTRKLELKANGKSVESKEVSLGPGENKTLTFGYKPTQPGSYKLSLDGKDSTITVEKAETNWAIIALVLVLLIAIGAGAYLYKTGELESLKKRLQR